MEEVNMDNVEEYIDLVMDFCLVSGIRRQMEAFRSKHLPLVCPVTRTLVRIVMIIM